MCFACDWGRHFSFQNSSGTGLPRRRVLQASAVLATAGGVAPFLKTSPSAAQVISAPEGKADLVFRNGPVYTVSGSQAWAQAVAVLGKRIIYVGDESGVEKLIGPSTRIVDLRGRMLLPGLVEGHVHPFVGSAITPGVDLQYDTREEVLHALEAYRSKIGKVQVVRGFGWRYNAFPATGPHKEDLDKIWPDTPVFLFAIDAHSAWVNSKALQIAGVTADTKDPLPGFSYFERDPATGEPTGYLVEVPVEAKVLNEIAPFSLEFVTESLEKWLPQASAAGITTVFDAGVQVLPEEDAFGTYLNLEQRGKLPIRVVGSTYHNNPAVDPVPVIQALSKQFHSELVQIRVLKLNMDGGEPQYTAALLEPYSDKPETSGDTLLPLDLFKDIVLRADAAGIDVHVHSWGDRANRLCLDTFEAVITANPPRDRRHTIAHVALVKEQDRPRFAKLGVIAQFSAQWAVPDQYYRNTMKERFGPNRADNAFSIGSILRHGATISLGTDWPASCYYSSFQPLDAIEIATTRKELNKPSQDPMPPADERITLAQALHANTMGAAYQLGLERDIGSIEVGKLADLIVLDRNIFQVAPHEIHNAKVKLTVMNGVIRHEDAA